MEGLLLLEEFDVTQLKSGDLSLKVEMRVSSGNSELSTHFEISS